MWALVTMTLLLGGGCRTGRPANTPSIASEPPYRSGSLWLCPGGSPYRADRGRYYPPNHPSPPLRRKPDGCFVSEADARAVGLRLAPTPAGALLVGGVYLVEASDELGRDCARRAGDLGLAVPCPTVVPFPADAEFVERGFGPGSPFVIDGSFAGPPGYAGVPGGAAAGHLVIAAGRVRHDPLVRFCTFDRPGLGSPDTSVGGQPAWFVECPDESGLMSGHVALRWLVDQISYVVSLHGHSNLNRKLDLVIAEHVRIAA